MSKQELTTARQIITILGVNEVAALTKASVKTVYHWGTIDSFPSCTYCIMRDELKRRGYKARPHLWAMTGFKKPRRYTNYSAPISS